MRKPIEPGSPKSTKGPHDLIPAKPAPHVDVLSTRGMLLGPSSRSRDYISSDKIVKEGRRVSKLPIGETGEPQIPATYRPMVLLLDNSPGLSIHGVVIDQATGLFLIQEVKVINAPKVQLSEGLGACATGDQEEWELSSPDSKQLEPWPHELQIDAITPKMRIQIAECAKRKSRLDPKVEDVVAGMFREKYLTCPMTKKSAWREVCQTCCFLSIKPPSYSATAERLDILFSQEVLRYKCAGSPKEI